MSRTERKELRGETGPFEHFLSVFSVSSVANLEDFIFARALSNEIPCRSLRRVPRRLCRGRRRSDGLVLGSG